MTPRPPILDELGRELVRAARAEQARSNGGVISRAPRALVIVLLTLLGLGAVAAAATLIVGRGDPIPAARAGDVPPELRPVPGTAHLSGLNVPDPDGGPAWDVRTSRSRTGAVCATVGQVLDGELGLLGLDRRFRELPAGAADTCSTPQSSGATLAGARGYRGGGRLGALTVVSGVAAPDVRRAVASAGGRSVRMRLGPGHAFLAVFRGLPEQVRPRVVLTNGSGHRTTLRFADSGEFIASDPSGGTPWALAYRKGAPGLRCVSAHRERGPDSPPPSPAGTLNFAPPSVPPRCAPAGRSFVAIRRFVPRAQRIGRAFWWGLNPARTVVWGAAPARAGAVVLHGAGAPRRLRVDPRHGGFVAVLDGHVDPRALRVTFGGRPPAAAAVGTKRQRLQRTPVPAWRSVAGAARPVAIQESMIPERASIATTLHASDPTGGPAWSLRSWKAHVDTRIAVRGGGGRDMRCYAIGLEQGGRLVEPRAGGATRVVGTGERDARCNSLQWLATHAPGAEVRAYVDDPEVPDPRPARVVVAGLLGEGVRSAQLLGAGAPRTLDLGRYGTFLVVLDPKYAGVTLRVHQVRADGRSRTSEAATQGIDCKPLPGRSVRVADPDGGQSWTTGEGQVIAHFDGPDKPGSGCQYTGRLAGDRLASVPEGETWLRYGADGFSSGGGSGLAPACLRGPLAGTCHPRKLSLQVRGPGSYGVQPNEPASPSPAQVARRTLPGRTVVTGVASPAVSSITLRTPRDVRTVRPGSGGVFLAVYDGPFYGGKVVATGHIRGGRDVTESAPVTPPDG